MPIIDEVAFARLVCNGKVYRNTCLVTQAGVNAQWWRKDGMAFSPEDFKDVLADPPKVVILGKGMMNNLTIPDATLATFEQAGVQVMVLPTSEAVEEYNQRVKKAESVVGAFHLM